MSVFDWSPLRDDNRTVLSGSPTDELAPIRGWMRALNQALADLRGYHDLQSGARRTDGGGDQYHVATRTGLSAYRPGLTLLVQADRDSVGVPELAPDSLPAMPWVDRTGAPMVVHLGRFYLCVWDDASGRWYSPIDALPAGVTPLVARVPVPARVLVSEHPGQTCAPSRSSDPEEIGLVRGVVAASAPIGAVALVITSGPVPVDPSLPDGADLFVGDAGAMTPVPPTYGFRQRIGRKMYGGLTLMLQPAYRVALTPPPGMTDADAQRWIDAFRAARRYLPAAPPAGTNAPWMNDGIPTLTDSEA